MPEVRSPPFLPQTDPPLSFMHATVNRNKRSLSLDLREPPGLEVMERLISGADIFIENTMYQKKDTQSQHIGHNDVSRDSPTLLQLKNDLANMSFAQQQERIGAPAAFPSAVQWTGRRWPTLEGARMGCW